MRLKWLAIGLPILFGMTLTSSSPTRADDRQDCNIGRAIAQVSFVPMLCPELRFTKLYGATNAVFGANAILKACMTKSIKKIALEAKSNEHQLMAWREAYCASIMILHGKGEAALVQRK